MQIRCNFPDISYLSETQKNNFQFLNDSIFQLTLEDVSKSKVYEFAANVWIRMDDFNDFWRELPVKKETDQLPGERRPVRLFALLMFDTLWHVFTKLNYEEISMLRALLGNGV